MRSANETTGPAVCAALPPEAEEEFVLQLTAHSGRVEGFVLHPKSGRREPVADWNHLTQVLNLMLAAADGSTACDD